MIVNNTALVWLGLSGTLCDAMGGIYLTYDLLGGRNGPLGFSTRAATYGLIFGLGYGLPFGIAFGIVAGLGLGSILALEFWRVARHQRLFHSSPLYNLPLFGAARGLVLGVAAVHAFGWRFGLRFGCLSAAGLYGVYHLRFAPTYDYLASFKPRLARHVLDAAFMRAVAVCFAGILAGYFGSHSAYSLAFSLELGCTAGVVSAVTGIVSPYIEWWIENLPEKHLAMLGFGMIFAGLVLQSVQYLAVLTP